ncbi:hypothetical protein IV203_010506 [Nitzschia inconspicua]|uniref:Uncharacterized protein n=1 Tax=Nitzschia inconspicua TaxID=303405 RepID=A0A9K3PLH0_9STRA|nr:hypothetical protein IV203_010506 [Nitzschia inconspicua]
MPVDQNSSRIFRHEDATMTKTTVVSGILFSRSIRSSFASLTLAPLASAAATTAATTKTVASEPPKHNTNPFLVRIQFPAPNSNNYHDDDNDDDTNNLISELRSYCRRHYKLGDRIDISHGLWEDCHNCTNNSIQNTSSSLSTSTSSKLVVSKREFTGFLKLQQALNHGESGPPSRHNASHNSLWGLALEALQDTLFCS